MTSQGAKVLALFATALCAVLVASRSVKAGNYPSAAGGSKGKFNAKGVIGVGVWGGVSALLASWQPELSAIASGLMLADVLVQPPNAGGQSEAASLINTLFGIKSSSAPGGGGGAVHQV